MTWKNQKIARSPHILGRLNACANIVYQVHLRFLCAPGDEANTVMGLPPLALKDLIKLPVVELNEGIWGCYSSWVYPFTGCDRFRLMLLYPGNVTYLLDVTPSNPLPHPLSPPPISLCVSSKIWLLSNIVYYNYYSVYICNQKV